LENPKHALQQSLEDVVKMKALFFEGFSALRMGQLKTAFSDEIVRRRAAQTRLGGSSWMQSCGVKFHVARDF
jgi:hypothetical protein